MMVAGWYLPAIVPMVFLGNSIVLRKLLLKVNAIYHF